MANKKYKLTDGNYWATDGIHDFGQNKTQREINAALVQADSDLSGALTKKLFIKSGTISSAHTSSTTTTLATDASTINANTDIANVWFNTPANITSDYTITTNASGQVQITCTNSAAVTVYVVLFNP